LRKEERIGRRFHTKKEVRRRNEKEENMKMEFIGFPA